MMSLSISIHISDSSTLTSPKQADFDIWLFTWCDPSEKTHCTNNLPYRCKISGKQTG